MCPNCTSAVRRILELVLTTLTKENRAQTMMGLATVAQGRNGSVREKPRLVYARFLYILGG